MQNEVLLIHVYIAPELSIEARPNYWTDLLILVENQTNDDHLLKVVLTGDLNTKNVQFGQKHAENHSDLDRALGRYSLDFVLCFLCSRVEPYLSTFLAFTGEA